MSDAIAARRAELRPTLERALDFAAEQAWRLLRERPGYYPMYTVGGKWRHAGEKWTQWTDGFLGGMMWQFHLRTEDAWWREKAEHYSRLLEHRQ